MMRTLNNEDIKYLMEFPSLSFLNLDGMDLSPESFRALAEIDSLNALSVGEEGANSFEGLSNLKNLTTLFLSKSNIEDKDMKHIVTLKKLTHLGLSNTAITDKGLTHIAKLKSLTIFFKLSKYSILSGVFLYNSPTIRNLLVGYFFTI